MLGRDCNFDHALIDELGHFIKMVVARLSCSVRLVVAHGSERSALMVRQEPDARPLQLVWMATGLPFGIMRRATFEVEGFPRDDG